MADQDLLLIWVTSLSFFTMIRLLFAYQFNRRVTNDTELWGRIYILGTFVSGCIWGMLAFIFDSQWSAAYQMILLLLLTGIIAGAIGTNSCLKFAYPAFLIPIIGMVILVLFFQSDKTYLLMALMIIIFTVQIFQTGCRYYNSLVDTLRLRFAIQHMAYYDQLTKLPNRPLLNDRCDQAIARAKRKKNNLAVLFIDLDKFKPVNDNFGHAVGDLLLKGVATRLQECVRESDTVARVGGDEFVVLLTTIKEEQSALIIAEKVHASLNRPFELAEHVIQISASIGIAIYPQDGVDKDSLFKNADSAMYEAKKSEHYVRLFKEGS